MDIGIRITDLRFPFPAYTLEGLKDGKFIGDVKFSDHNETVVSRWKSEAIKLEKELKNIRLENYNDVIVIIGGYSFSPESGETNVWSSLKKSLTNTRKRLFLVILPESEGDITEQRIKECCFGDDNDTFKIYRTLFPCLAQKNIALDSNLFGKQMGEYNDSDMNLIVSINRSIKRICENIIEFNIDIDDYDNTKNLIFINDAVVIHRKRTGEFRSAKEKLSKYISPRSLVNINDMVKEILEFYFFESIWTTFDGLIKVLRKCKKNNQDLSNIYFIQNQYKEGESKKQIILLGNGKNSRYPLDYHNSIYLYYDDDDDDDDDERKYYKKYLKYKTKYLQLKKRMINFRL